MRWILWAILLWALPVWGEPLDLSTEAPWELRLDGGESYRVGQRMAFDLRADGDPYASGSGDPMAGDETILPGERQFSSILLDGRQELPEDPEPGSFLDWSPAVASAEVWTGLVRGHLVGIKSARPGSHLSREGAVVGWVGESLRAWEGRLGAPNRRVAHFEHEIDLYQATMADIGLQVEAGKVVALILMEPGQLRTQLLRRGDYREI